MLARLLGHPAGTAGTAERPDGRGNGLPDLTRAGLIAALQHRREDRISPDSTHAEVRVNRPHHGPPRQYFSVPMSAGRKRRLRCSGFSLGASGASTNGYEQTLGIWQADRILEDP